MIVLRTTVNSFDLFDTLLARKCIGPHEIFLEVERALGAPGFAQARRAAELRLAETRATFDIHDIYDHLVSTRAVDRVGADRLLAAEIEAEFDNAIPIAENIRRVREGDLVISDMYLPQDVLRRLLQHIGLRVHVYLYVTNLGKHLGHVWSDLSSRWIVCSHMGDNAHSDVATPRLHGVRTIAYGGARLTPVESLVTAQGLPALARLMRSLRLGNPFNPGCQEHELWLLACQLNLPLLMLMTRLVRQRREATGAKRILFSARDCYLLSEIFSALFPGEASEYVYVSREVLLAGGAPERDYLLSKGLEDSLICDIAATGSSWYEFTELHGVAANLFTLVFIDNWALSRIRPETVVAAGRLQFAFAIRSSALKTYSPGIEVLNSAPHGACLGLVPTGRFFSPQFSAGHDIGDEVMSPLLRCHVAAMASLRQDRAALVRELDSHSSDTLVQTLVEAISSSALLNSLGKQLLWPPSFGQTTH